MSHYLSHLAALTLNQLEPVQPRLANRFETTLDNGASDNPSLFTEEAFRSPEPVAQAQPTMVNTAMPPVTEKYVTPSEIQEHRPDNGNDRTKVIENTEVKVKQPALTIEQQQAPSAFRFAAFDTMRPNRAVQSPAQQPINMPIHEPNQGMLPIDRKHTIVERVQEHFINTTHNELRIKAVDSAIGEQQNKHSEAAVNPDPVKPTSIVIHAAPTTGAELNNKLGNYSIAANPFAAEETPAPTINVTIGRIEIRATQVTDKSAPKSRSTANTTLSLNDYLKQRNGGTL